MALTNYDRDLLQACLSGDAQAWQEFVDRFLGLVVHVVNHTAATRNIVITPESRDDLVAEVFLAYVDKDFAVLRRFRAKSSLATYLTVVARRTITRKLSQLRVSHTSIEDSQITPTSSDEGLSKEHLEDLDSSMRLLSDNEAAVVRMFHLEGKTYSEISLRIGVPENSIGPILSRAREKMKSRVELPR